MKKILLLISFLFPLISFGTNYFVSSSGGADGNNGTSTGTAWASITKVNGFAFQPGDIISLKAGDTFFGQLVISRSGTAANPIIYNSYGAGAKPIITGFTTISSWTNLSGNLWQSTNTIGVSQLNMVLVNNVFTPIGKWPDGTNVYADINTNTALNQNITLNGSGVPSAVPAGVTGGQIVIRKNHWILDKSVITSQSGNTLNFTSPNNYNISVGCFGGACWGFFVQNSPAVCTVQNEWWWASQKIGMYSVGTPSNVKVASIEVLLNIGSAVWVNFTGLAFEGSNTSAVAITTGNNIAFTSCDWSNHGMNGFQCAAAVNHITLSGCTAERTNNNFINGGGSSNWTIINTTINNTARVAGMGNSSDGQYIGMYNINTSTIQNCIVTRTGYSGIDFRGPGTLVKNNLVDSFCMTKDDGAGIYTFTGTTTTVYSPPRIVDGNIVLNGGGANKGTNTANWDAAGIYMDGNASEVTITNNTVANCGETGLFLNGNHALNITNNTLFNNPTTGGYGNVLEVYPVAGGSAAVRNLLFQNNKIISKAANQLVAYLKTDEANMRNWVTPNGTAASWDNNYWCRPVNDLSGTSNPFTLITSGGTQITNLAGWVTQSTFDAHSKKSPINVLVTDIRFEYNATGSTVNISLGGNAYVDVTGLGYSGTLTLGPYSSWVGLRNGTGNALPVVSAGADQTITLPTSSVSVTGTATDADGTIASRQWTQISGPTTATITTPTLATTTITGLAVGVYIFQFRATDNLGGTAVDQMQVTVNPAPNQLPSANAGADKVIQLPTNSVSQTGSGSDPDGTIVGYLWTQVSGPSTATITSASQATTSFNNLIAGTYLFNLRVTDNQGATGNDQFQVLVNPAANTPPTANAGINQTITLPTNSVTLFGSGTDVDGTITGFAWTKISGPATFTIVSPSSASTAVNNLVAGTYIFQLTVTDNQGATGSATVQVLVNAAPPPNQQPVVNAGADRSITLPINNITQVGSATDADGTVASYAWTKISGPATFTIVTPTTSSSQFTNLVQGTYVFQLAATDNLGATGTDQFTVIVNPAPNIPPTTNAGPDQTITLPTTTTSLAGTAVDEDGTITSHTWSFISGPATPVIVTPGSYTSAVTGLTVAGSYTLRLSATDNSASTTTDNMIILVNPPPNQPPIANAGTDKNITLPTNSLTQVGSGSDPDGTIVSYLWTKISGPTSFNIVSASQATTVINNLVQGTYVFNLRVTDNSGANANDQVTIVVSPAINQFPTANAGANQTITLPTNSVTLVGSGSDPDGTITAYAWTKISGPATFTIVSPTNATTVVNNLVAGTYVFQLQVTDNGGATATNTTQVVVNAAPPPNQPPIANAGTDKNITLPTNSISQIGSGTDADGTVVSYAWTKISGPATFTIAAPSSSTTTISNLVVGTYVFQLLVTDNQGATGTDQMTVIVNPAPNIPPVANAGPDQTKQLPTTSSAFAGSATDQDGTITSHIWSFVSGPATPTITTPSSYTSSVTGMSVAGSYTFRLTVVDNSAASNADNMIILVNPAPNVPPVVNAGANQEDTIGNVVTLTATATDADGTIVSRQWTQVSGPTSVIINAPTSLMTTIDNLTIGTYVLRFKATDNSGAFTTDDITVTIVGIQPPHSNGPTANAGPDLHAIVCVMCSSTSVTAVGSGTPDQTPIVSYQWTKLAGPAQGNVNSANTAVTSIIGLVRGTYVFQLTVTDAAGLSSTDTMTVDVRKNYIVWRSGRIIIIPL